MSRSSIVAVLVVVLAGSATAADYWPLTPGATFTYQYGTGTPFTDEIVINTTEPRFPGWSRRESTTSGYVRAWEYYLDGDGGDVLWGGYTTIGGIDPDQKYFDPPVLFIKQPMTPGMYWQNQTTVDYMYGTYPATYWCWVSSGGTVSTPAGDFETVKLTVSDGMFIPFRTYHLCRDLGPVVINNRYLLTDWTGIVSNENATWGEVKALYNR